VWKSFDLDTLPFRRRQNHPPQDSAVFPPYFVRGLSFSPVITPFFVYGRLSPRVSLFILHRMVETSFLPPIFFQKCGSGPLFFSWWEEICKAFFDAMSSFSSFQTPAVLSWKSPDGIGPPLLTVRPFLKDVQPRSRPSSQESLWNNQGFPHDFMRADLEEPFFGFRFFSPPTLVFPQKSDNPIKV